MTKGYINKFTGTKISDSFYKSLRPETQKKYTKSEGMTVISRKNKVKGYIVPPSTRERQITTYKKRGGHSKQKRLTKEEKSKRRREVKRDWSEEWIKRKARKQKKIDYTNYLKGLVKK